MNALLAILLSGVGSAAIDHARFRHPAGDYALEYPARWKRSAGIQTLLLRPAGAAGDRTRVSLERYPVNRGDPRSAEQYVGATMESLGGISKLERDETVSVAGVDARRLWLSETVKLRGAYGEALPGPLRSVIAIIPSADKFFVLKLEAIGKDFDATLPAFEAIARSLRIPAK